MKFIMKKIESYWGLHNLPKGAVIRINRRDGKKDTLAKVYWERQTKDGVLPALVYTDGKHLFMGYSIPVNENVELISDMEKLYVPEKAEFSLAVLERNGRRLDEIDRQQMEENKTLYRKVILPNGTGFTAYQITEIKGKNARLNLCEDAGLETDNIPGLWMYEDGYHLVEDGSFFPLDDINRLLDKAA